MRTPHLSSVPGLGLLLVVGVVAFVVGSSVPRVNALIIAVVLGAVLSNLVGVPSWAEDGVGHHKLLLETGIVLMGVRVSLDQIVNVGPVIVLFVTIFVAISLLVVEALSRRVFDLPTKLGTLLASGSSICGVSAIVAVAGSIRARGDQITYAVSTILLFDALTLFVYPVVGELLHLPDRVFGIWAGVSMFSTGPVTAAGFIYSDTAGQWAAITKVTRNAFIGVAAILYAVYYNTSATSDRKLDSLWASFPKFVLGFVAVVAVANLGVLSGPEIAQVEEIYHWLFILAFVGLGFDIQIADMRDTGVKPVLTVLVTLVAVSILSLSTSLLVFS